MNDSLIFCKTLAGEEVVRERTRLVQRNLRMVLIVVDGYADVTEIKRQIGDPALVDSALAELEQMGLIEPLGADAARAEAAEATAALAERRIEPPVIEAPQMAMREPEPSAPEPKPAAPEPVVSVPAPIPQAPAVPVPKQPPAWRKLWDRWRAHRAEKAFERAYADEQPPEAAVRSAMVRRGPRTRIGWALGIVLGLAATVVAALLIILIFPYGRYRPDVEKALSRALGDVVRVEAMAVAFTPLPNIAVTGVTVGEDGYARAARILLLPELGSLLGSHKRFREVRATGVVIREAGLARAAGWLGAEEMQGMVVHRLSVENLGFEAAGASLGGLAGDAELAAGGGLTKWSLHNPENTLQLELVPRDDGFRIAAAASGWHAPFRAGLVFKSLDVQADLTAGRLILAGIDGQLYEGRIQGTGTLSWAGGATFAADLEYKHVALGQLMAALAGQPVVEGHAAGKLRIDAKAASPGRLAEEARMEADFTVGQGALKQVDLAEAVRGGNRGAPIRGGTTRFEQLSGSFVRDEKGVRLSGLQLASGLMRATGQVAVTPDGTIAGTGTLELKGAGGLRAAIAIGGPAADPELRTGR